MKEYNVKEVASLVGASEETVRRWVRAGKLEGYCDSYKEGVRVTEEALKAFLAKTPKYVNPAMLALGAVNPAIAASNAVGTLAAVATSLMAGKKVYDEHAGMAVIMKSKDVENYLKTEIRNRTERLREKEERARGLRREIEEERQVIGELRETLMKLRSEEEEV